MYKLLAETLFRSLRERARALGEYVKALQSDNSGATAGFHGALDLVFRYTDAISRHAARFWEDNPDPFDRYAHMAALLQDLFSKEETIDQWFARSGQHHVPRALPAIVYEQFQDLGLGNIVPVLTVGPPGNFETLIADLRSYLFHDLWGVAYEVMTEYQEGEYALIAVPHLEGTQAFWQPIVIGHEAAHVRIFRNNNLDVPGVRERVWLRELLEPWLREQFPEDSQQVQTPPAWLLDWVEEILCDFNAVRLYGPAAVAAVGEILAVTGRTDGGLGTRSHPPMYFRLELMLRIVDATARSPKVTGKSDWARMLAPWRAFGNLRPVGAYPAQSVLDMLSDRTKEMFDVVKGWSTSGDEYRIADRHAIASWVSKRLLDGIPGGTHFLAEEPPKEAGKSTQSTGRGRVVKPVPVLEPDVVNAAWLAEYLVSEMKDEDRAPAEKVPIDRLATKAVDTIKFTQLWVKEGKRSIDLGPSPDGPEGGPGVLSGADLQRRLKRVEDNVLVVTPLLDGAVQEAGLDLRLATGFIVFQHASTAVFGAVNEDRADPRNMQEFVEKDWGDKFILHPGELVLAASLEYLVVPNDLAAQVVTRSSYGRLGLITATAVQVQPGSYGCLTLELVNLGQTPVALTPGERIAQLVFHRLTRPITTRHPSDAKYPYPTGPQFSRVEADSDDIRALQDIRAYMKRGPARRSARVRRDWMRNGRLE